MYNSLIQLQKGRSASKDNLGILFPDEKKDVETSPRRKLPSIRDHNSMEEDPEEGKFTQNRAIHYININ